jgi:exosortase K
MRALPVQWLPRVPWVAWALTLAGALLLKLDYHRATVSTLRWLLGPTASLVGWLRDQSLLMDPAHGWVATDGSFVIAPACAGVNFLIVAFVTAALGFVHRFHGNRARAAWLLGAALGAWALTILVNTLRIVLAVELYAADAHLGWLTPERLHRLAGTAIYVLALWAEWHTLDRVSARLATHAPDFAHRHGTWLVLAAYLGMTIAIPLANGAFQQFGPIYVEHALTVTAVAAALLTTLSVLATRCKFATRCKLATRLERASRWERALRAIGTASPDASIGTTTNGASLCFLWKRAMPAIFALLLRNGQVVASLAGARG